MSKVGVPGDFDAGRFLLQRCGIDVVDVVDPSTDQDHADALARIHLRHFPGHTHVAAEIVELRGTRTEDPRHAWLLLRDGAPIGEVIFGVVARREMALMHFVVVDAEHRPGLPLGWFAHLIDAIEAAATADAHAQGAALRGIVAEVEADATARWIRTGFRVVPIDYREPHHGMHWRSHGEPTFFSMTPVLKCTAAGAAEPFGEVAADAISAFLLDHYRLEPDHPAVRDALSAARAL